VSVYHDVITTFVVKRPSPLARSSVRMDSRNKNSDATVPVHKAGHRDKATGIDTSGDCVVCTNEYCGSTPARDKTDDL
jgi:hypothetical protein